jgi:hypothetical protein
MARKGIRWTLPRDGMKLKGFRFSVQMSGYQNCAPGRRRRVLLDDSLNLLLSGYSEMIE